MAAAAVVAAVVAARAAARAAMQVECSQLMCQK